MGVKGYGKSEMDMEEGQDSIPVGYENVVEMYPLDFEEFLWANGINEKVIATVKSCFEYETVVPDGIHKVMMELLYRYVIVGGLPDVVNTFLDAFQAESVYFTVDGQILESGHVIYDFAMPFFSVDPQPTN